MGEISIENGGEDRKSWRGQRRCDRYRQAALESWNQGSRGLGGWGVEKSKALRNSVQRTNYMKAFKMH